MGRTRSYRPGQRLSQTRSLAGGAARSGPIYRPRLELLEDRIQPGDTILGLSAVALWGLGSTSFDAPLTLDLGAQDRAWHHGLFSSLDVTGSRRTDGASSDAISDLALIAPTAETVIRCAMPISGADDALAGQVAVHRLAGAALLPSQALAVGFGMADGGGGVASMVGVPSAPVALAGIGRAGHSPQMFLAAPTLSFDVWPVGNSTRRR